MEMNERIGFGSNPEKSEKVEKSEKIITAVSVVFLVPMTFFGFYILIKSGYNFTFLAISIYLSVMLFIKNSK